jgi:hypothetical protein
MIYLSISAIAGVVCISSTFMKNKERMLLVQCLEVLLHGLSNLLQGGYTAVFANAFAFLRNLLYSIPAGKRYKSKVIQTILNYCAKDRKYLITCLLILIVAYSFKVNTRGYLGWLPIIATAEYSLLTMITKSIRGQRAVLLLNCVIWALYDGLILMWPALLMDMIIGLTAAIQLVLYFKKDNSKGDN